MAKLYAASGCHVAEYDDTTEVLILHTLDLERQEVIRSVYLMSSTEKLLAIALKHSDHDSKGLLYYVYEVLQRPTHHLHFEVVALLYEVDFENTHLIRPKSRSLAVIAKIEFKHLSRGCQCLTPACEMRLCDRSLGLIVRACKGRCGPQSRCHSVISVWHTRERFMGWNDSTDAKLLDNPIWQMYSFSPCSFGFLDEYAMLVAVSSKSEGAHLAVVQLASFSLSGPQDPRRIDCSLEDLFDGLNHIGIKPLYSITVNSLKNERRPPDVYIAFSDSGTALEGSDCVVLAVGIQAIHDAQMEWFQEVTFFRADAIREAMSGLEARSTTEKLNRFRISWGIKDASPGQDPPLAYGLNKPLRVFGCRFVSPIFSNTKGTWRLRTWVVPHWYSPDWTSADEDGKPTIVVLFATLKSVFPFRCR
ncbi:hypothetical protein BXZ70DRAFT_330258 [Cristinia sonorae]|uniref:Uncharacterized protein n=1 Tax=Cristinia sonorae TaxID=1940300 RepID=A0A8K0XN98_9AGAR|nr:hypothetical protein BXZ70DRAFT_330258 [Cristinia sonorae]